MASDEVKSVEWLYEMQNDQRAPLSLFIFTKKGLVAFATALVAYIMIPSGWPFKSFGALCVFVGLYRFLAPHTGEVYSTSNLPSKLRFLFFCLTGR